MKRLLEGDASEFERGLLDALQFERPSAELEQRMRAAIGLGPVPAPTPSLPASPAAPAAKSFGAWTAIAAGTVAAAVVIAGGAVMGGDEAPFSAPAEAPAVVTPAEAEGPTPTPLSELAPEAPAAAEERPSTTSRAPQKTT